MNPTPAADELESLRRSCDELQKQLEERTRELQVQNDKRERMEAALREVQALYESLVEQLPTGVFRKDREGRFVTVNSAFCRIRGLTAGEILGKTPGEVAACELANRGADQAQHASLLDKLVTQGADHHEMILQTGRQIEVEEEYPGPGGDKQHLHVLKFPVFGPDGGIVGTQGIMFDISARKRAEEALAREHRFMRTLIDNLPDSIYAKDMEGRKVMANPADLVNLRCKTEADAVGKNDFDLFPPEIAAKFWADDQAVLRGDPVLNREEFFFDEQGRKRWLLTSKLPRRDQNGIIIGLIGIGREITALKEAEEKVTTLHAQLLSASRQAGMAEVATEVLHNVGNVLNSVNVSTQVISDRLLHSRADWVVKLSDLFQEHRADLARFLTEDERGRKVPEYIQLLARELDQERQEVRKELEALARSVDHIKEIVALQQEHARVLGVVETVSLSELLEDALKLNSEACVRHGITVTRKFDSLPPVGIDKHKVLQILVNLISNAKYACDAALTSGKRVEVRLKAGPPGRVLIEIADNGVGIAPENLARVFSQRFTTRKGGHGYGLHSGALAAREMGGSLTVHSDGLGHGATFTLELPVVPPAHPTTQ